MTSRYRLTPSALADIGEVVDYLHDVDPIIAVRFLESAQATFEHLGHAPNAYPRFSTVGGRLDLRWRPLTGAFGKYLVFYRVDVDDGATIIVRVVHSARDLSKLVGQ